MTERGAYTNAADLAGGAIALGDASGEERVNRIMSAELRPTGRAAVRADIEPAAGLLQAGLGSFAGWRSE